MIFSPQGFKELEDYLSDELFETNDDNLADDNPDGVPDNTPRSAEDGITLEDFIDEQSEADNVDDSWKEGVINNVDDFMLSDDISDGDFDISSIPQHGMDINDMLAGPAEFVFTDGFLEINDLILPGGDLENFSSNISAGEHEGLSSRGSEIQLRPRRSSPRRMQFDPQGDTARRMLLMRHSESQQNDLDRTLSSSRNLHTSASSRNLSEFAERATSSLGFQRQPEEGCPVDGDLLSMAREDTGDLPDSGTCSGRHC